MISVDNAPVVLPVGNEFLRYIQGMRDIQNSKIMKRVEADHIMERYEKSLPLRQFLLTNLTRPPGSVYFQFRIPLDILESSLQAVGSFPFKDTDEVSYAGPSLFIRGSKSHYVPDVALPLLRKMFPRSELHDIDCGHWVISEQPEVFRKVVVEFILQQPACNPL
jgi:pimeloyl-ACP methyl ester carboxylesterase